MVTLKQVKNGAKIDEPVYVSKPYVILAEASKANAGMILAADTLEGLKLLSDYYDGCPVKVRQFDLYLNDNTRLPANDYSI
jgi:hypothetical protein